MYAKNLARYFLENPFLWLFRWHQRFSTLFVRGGALTRKHGTADLQHHVLPTPYRHADYFNMDVARR